MTTDAMIEAVARASFGAQCVTKQEGERRWAALEEHARNDWRRDVRLWVGWFQAAGYKVLPREPTEAMRRGMMRASRPANLPDRGDILDYQAAWDAAE